MRQSWPFNNQFTQAEHWPPPSPIFTHVYRKNACNLTEKKYFLATAEDAEGRRFRHSRKIWIKLRLWTTQNHAWSRDRGRNKTKLNFNHSLPKRISLSDVTWQRAGYTRTIVSDESDLVHVRIAKKLLRWWLWDVSRKGSWTSGLFMGVRAHHLSNSRRLKGKNLRGRTNICDMTHGDSIPHVLNVDHKFPTCQRREATTFLSVEDSRVGRLCGETKSHRGRIMIEYFLEDLGDLLLVIAQRGFFIFLSGGFTCI